MANIKVCDICKKDGKLTETTRYMSVKGMPNLRLDYCESCKSKIPVKMVDYAKLCYSLMGITLTDADATLMLKARR